MSQSVLVVEDYADLRAAIVAALLLRSDCTCDNARNAEAAVDLLRARHYDTILLSARLPIQDDPVMHFLAANCPEQLANVVLMTDSDEPVSPATRVLSKPFNQDELLAEVGK